MSKLTVQEMILTLQKFWSDNGCMLMQAYDTEKGAGTMSPYTFLRAIGPEPWNAAYVEPSRRPADGRHQIIDQTIREADPERMCRHLDRPPQLAGRHWPELHVGILQHIGEVPHTKSPAHVVGADRQHAAGRRPRGSVA